MKLTKRPYIIWIDVDDVLVHFRPMFNRYLINTYKFKITENHVAKDWTYSDVLPKNHEFMDYFNALPENWTENQEIIAGAKEFIDELRAMGFYLIFITSVPEKQIHYRIKNLSEHKLIYDEIYFTSRPKSFYANPAILQFANSDDIKHILIDDRATNCVDFLTNVKNTIHTVSMDIQFNSKELANQHLYNGQIDFNPKTSQDMHQALLTYLKNLK